MRGDSDEEALTILKVRALWSLLRLNHHVHRVQREDLDLDLDLDLDYRVEREYLSLSLDDLSILLDES